MLIATFTVLLPSVAALQFYCIKPIEYIAAHMGQVLPAVEFTHCNDPGFLPPTHYYQLRGGRTTAHTQRHPLQTQVSVTSELVSLYTHMFT
jgi:hypothetical protein